MERGTSASRSAVTNDQTGGVIITSTHAACQYQYQILANSPNFTDEPRFGIRPSGLTAGVSWRIFSRR